MEFELGEAIPWEPIPPGQLPIPGREERADRLHRTLENDQDYYEERRKDILKQLEEIANGLARGGNSGGGNKRPPTGGTLGPSDHWAWYVSFRSAHRWGVFISLEGLQKVAEFMVHCGADPHMAFESARYMLQNHETAHFLIDRAVLTLEMNAALLSGGQPPQYWINYHFQHLPYSDIEEALCNAYAYRMADARAKEFLQSCMECQPHGYSDFNLGMPLGSPGSFFQCESQLLSDYQMGRHLQGKRRVIGLHSLMQYTEPLLGKKGDLYITRGNKKEKLPVYFVP